MARLRFPEDYTRGRVERRGPWPGPIPYTEADSKHYRGRTEESNAVLEKIYVDRLLLITGYSGVGKTSFLRAGVIPRLRAARAEAVLKHKDWISVPAVLTVRNWVTTQRIIQDDPREILKEAIIDGINAFESEVLPAYKGDQNETVGRCIVEDIEKLRGVDKSLGAYDYIIGLAKATGSLLLCMDQFEEVLQGGTEQRNAILDTIAVLAKEQSCRLKILLSFRQEFWFLFRRLDDQMGDLTQATEYLEDMPELRVRNAILEAAESADVGVSEEALNRLFAWMQKSHREQGSTQVVSIAPHEAFSKRLSSATSVDLLRLQALLQELYRMASDKTKSVERVTITEALVTRLLEEAKGEDPLNLFLERRVLPLPIVESVSGTEKAARLSAMTGLPRDLNTSDEEALLNLLQERRVVARMAPFFSSRGLKVQQYEAHLIANALREDWDTLELRPDEVEKALASGDVQTALASLGLPNAEITREDAILSGNASVLKIHTYSDAAKYLIDGSCAALKRLANCNVLRAKRTLEGSIHELVHDGFGPALSAWSDHVRGDPLDILGAVIARRGEVFRWRQLAGSIEQVCWRGCLVGPATGCDQLEFDNVQWLGCDLRGTIFTRCSFEGGLFDDCALHGAMFVNCTFDGRPKAPKPFTFSRIRANGLTFAGGSFRDVEFVGGRLDKMLWDVSLGGDKLLISNVVFRSCQPIYQWSIAEGCLVRSGGLRLDSCELRLCDLQHLLHKDEQDEAGLEIQRCKFYYCLLDETLARLIDRSIDNERLPEQNQT